MAHMRQADIRRLALIGRLRQPSSDRLSHA